MCDADKGVEVKTTRATGIGILVGFAGGALLGGIIDATPAASTTLKGVGISPEFFLIGATLLGGAWGAIVGSFIGLNPKAQT
jgi:hypothetical protein